jgi:type IV secretion system protein VirD4
MWERIRDLRLVWGGIAAVSISVLACLAATQVCAQTFNYQAALGRPAFVFGSTPIYAPFSVLTWSRRWGAQYPRAFALPKLLVFAGFLSSAMLVLLALKAPHPSQRPFGAKSWGGRKDARAAGLFAESGAIIGKFDGEILAYDGPHHLLLTGGTRSGKTRGSVIPTLLALPIRSSSWT